MVPNLTLPWTWNMLNLISWLPCFPFCIYLRSFSSNFLFFKPKEKVTLCLCNGLIFIVALSLISHILWLFWIFSYCIVILPSASKLSCTRIIVVSFLTVLNYFAWCNALTLHPFLSVLYLSPNICYCPLAQVPAFPIHRFCPGVNLLQAETLWINQVY